MQERAPGAPSGATPPPAAPPLAGVLDPAVVDQLRALAGAGSPGLLHKLQESFARDTPPRLLALRAAVAAGDADGVAFNVHTIKGSAANLGATAIVATCQKLESAPGSGTEELEPLLAELERDTADATAELARLAESA